MCRHLAYLGPPLALREVLAAPPHSLYRQSWAPRLQRHGTINADGFGVGWYVPGDSRPARYRRNRPMWGDTNLPDLARVTRSGAVLAAVRDATAGCSPDESATAPFADADGPWLFSHNGALPGWPAALAGAAAALTPAELLDLPARSDSALVWALLLRRLRAGDEMSAALAETTTTLAAAAPTARLNLLLTDGHRVAATAWGDTLFHLHRPGHSLTVASEPHDDDPRWTQVPDRHLVTGDPAGVRLDELKEPTA